MYVDIEIIFLSNSILSRIVILANNCFTVVVQVRLKIIVYCYRNYQKALNIYCKSGWIPGRR